jgi:GTP-binding protein YchF
MALRCGLVGRPGSGKTTVFNAVTAAGASSFDAAELHRATVEVPDPRVAELVRLYQPTKVVRASVQVADIPGLAIGEGAGGERASRLLAHIKESDVLIHVVRCFSSPEGAPNPIHDAELVDLELMAADSATLDRMRTRIVKRARMGDREAAQELEDCERVRDRLHDGLPARRQELSDRERESLFECNLLSLKPVLYVANVGSSAALNGPDVARLQSWAAEERAETVPLCGQDEADVSELPPDERAPFLAELGLTELSVERLIHAAYRELGLVDFFTASEREVHVWTCRAGDKAPAAAGRIHSDMERGFVRMEVVPCAEFIRLGTEDAVAKAGKRRLEGRGYGVQDGDIVVIRFTPPTA